MNPGQISLMRSVWAICVDQNVQTEGTANEGDNRSKPRDWFSGWAWHCRGECGQSGVGASSSPQGIQERKALSGLRIQRCPAFLPPELGRCWASQASQSFGAIQSLVSASHQCSLVNHVPLLAQILPVLCGPAEVLFLKWLLISYLIVLNTIWV